MAKVKFYLERRKDKDSGVTRTKDVAIVGHVHYHSRKFVYFTGERTDLRYWDTKQQRVKNGAAGRAQINDILETQSETIKKAYREATINGTHIDNEFFKKCLKGENPAKPVKAPGFFTLWDIYIAGRKNEYSVSFNKSLVSARNHFGNFCKEEGITPTFKTLDLSVLERFRDYLIESVGVQNSTVATNIKRLKFFLTHSLKLGYPVNLSYKEFSIALYDCDIYYITWEELLVLLNFKLPRISLEQARDVYCLSCLTGLRYSDVKNMKRSNISGDFNFLRFKTVKTKEPNSVPLTDMAKDILRKYMNYPGNNALPVLSNQKTNDHLKTICEMAGITQPVTKTKFVGNKRIETIVPKYSVITFHTGRKSFVINALRSGMSTEIIMSITGHRTHAAFRRYYQILDDHKLSEMRKHFGNGDKC